MKNLWKTALLFPLPLWLTGCDLRIRWQGVTHVVPWYVVWLPAIVFTVIVLALCVRYYTNQSYRCPRCGHVFQPRRREISILLHQNDEHVARCPRCGRKGFCPRDDL